MGNQRTELISCVVVDSCSWGEARGSSDICRKTVTCGRMHSTILFFLRVFSLDLATHFIFSCSSRQSIIFPWSKLKRTMSQYAKMFSSSSGCSPLLRAAGGLRFVDAPHLDCTYRYTTKSGFHSVMRRRDFDWIPRHESLPISSRR